jgi:hypothetical protein
VKSRIVSAMMNCHQKIQKALRAGDVSVRFILD